jgi:adenine phosphoribosyltransferase
VEARGFIFAPALAYHLGAGFVPVRKPRKLPAECASISYDLEYGQDTLQIHRDAVGDGHRVIIADDLLATGGTARAVVDLVEQLGGTVVGLVFVVELRRALIDQISILIDALPFLDHHLRFSHLRP